MNARIDDADIKHLKAFSDAYKVRIMHKLMSHPTGRTLVLEGNTDFEKSLLKLRREGFGLIDLQAQETVCATVWYRRSPSLLKIPIEDVTAVNKIDRSLATPAITLLKVAA